MFQLDTKSRRTIYQQVVDNVKELILSGVLKEEEQLPSVRELSKLLTVNPNTVLKAYRELEYEGYVYSTVGQGTFVQKRQKGKVDEELLFNGRQSLENGIKELLYAGLSEEDTLKEVNAVLEKFRKGTGSK
ncbi:MAG: GntR family transcriptional regulator [Clostridiales bacterium]|nr:GntR family transcriptional regulator [Clostridiales bacterium]